MFFSFIIFFCDSFMIHFNFFTWHKVWVEVLFLVKNQLCRALLLNSLFILICLCVYSYAITTLSWLLSLYSKSYNQTVYVLQLYSLFSIVNIYKKKKKTCWNFYWACVESIQIFESNWHLNNTVRNFIKFIPMNIIFDVMNVFFISVSNCSLILYINTINSYILTLYLVILPNLFIHFSILFWGDIFFAIFYVGNH